MDWVSTLAYLCVLTLLLGLILTIFLMVLRGDINVRGLLCEKIGPSRHVSPARIQLLLVTLGFAFGYIAEAAQTYKLPDISRQWLLLLTGSHSVYLSNKAYKFFVAGNSNKS